MSAWRPCRQAVWSSAMSETKKRIRKSRKFERDSSQKLGGRTTYNSGAGAEKGDARVPGRWSVENKATDRKSFSIRSDTWETIRGIAMQRGENPVLLVQMRNRHGKPVQLAVLDINDFYGLVDDTTD